jgi:hypothetical protein
MMHPCAREITWAGGTHTFNLANKHAMFRLEGTWGFGGGQVKPQDAVAARLWRLENQAFSTSDVADVIYAGLIGGGHNWSQAQQLVEKHVENQPVAANALVAHEILEALFVGMKADASASA